MEVSILIKERRSMNEKELVHSLQYGFTYKSNVINKMSYREKLIHYIELTNESIKSISQKLGTSERTIKEFINGPKREPRETIGKLIDIYLYSITDR